MNSRALYSIENRVLMAFWSFYPSRYWHHQSLRLHQHNQQSWNFLKNLRFFRFLKFYVLVILTCKILQVRSSNRHNTRDKQLRTKSCHLDKLVRIQCIAMKKRPKIRKPTSCCFDSSQSTEWMGSETMDVISRALVLKVIKRPLCAGGFSLRWIFKSDLHQYRLPSPGRSYFGLKCKIVWF